MFVLNDWLCDTSTWDVARAYLDRERFSFFFTDLRGYGRSKEMKGKYDVNEGANDVLALANSLGLMRFSIVGHSMSCLVAMHLAQHQEKRIEKIVLLTPPSPKGMGGSDQMVANYARIVKDPAKRADMLSRRFLDDYAPGWAIYKGERWAATADFDAVGAYSAMFARDGLPDQEKEVMVPVLAVAGQLDSPPMRRDVVFVNLNPMCVRLEVTALQDAGHYPMQEMPIRTVTLIERFLA